MVKKQWCQRAGVRGVTASEGGAGERERDELSHSNPPAPVQPSVKDGAESEREVACSVCAEACSGL